MKKIFILLTLSVLIFSCEKEDSVFNPENNAIENQELIIDYDYESKLKLDFAKALAIAFSKSEPLREFIKEEALKMFDKDYEVLYYLVKDEKLSNGRTVRDLLLSQYEDENRLYEIENTNPLLTILVPELPEDSFSAKIWNTDNDIPLVAIRMNTTNHVPIVSSDGKVRILEAGIIPAFPVVVLKNNERLVVNKSVTKNSSIKGSIIKSKVDGGLEFRFLHDRFDGKLPISENSEKSTIGGVDPKLQRAFYLFRGNQGWQRDHVYYNLTHTNTKGAFSFNFQEFITNFSLKGDPWNVYYKIAEQQSDPRINLIKPRSGNSNWTGGFFEFKIRVLINSKNGLGSEFITYFSASPNQLFDLSYERIRLGLFTKVYVLESIDLKEMNVNLPIFNWDIDQFASSIKIEIEEVDLTVTTVLTDTRVVKFANNFSISNGTKKKIGLKFGSTLETTTTQTIQKTFTEGNDKLGSVIINFGDDMLIHHYASSYYETRDYSSGWFKIGFLPKKVQ